MEKKAFRAISLVDQIVDILKNKILIGGIKGGEQLLEDQLRDELDVSRAPLREAIRVLEKEGFVEIIPRKGAFVKKISRVDIEEIFPVRATLEGLAARLAYKNLTSQDLEEMEEVLGNMQEAAAGKNYEDYFKHHRVFHTIFIKASENGILISILKNLHMHALWHRYTYQYHQQDLQSSLLIHRRILDLFKEKSVQPRKIEQVVRQHMEKALGVFIKAMKSLETQQ